MRKADCVCFCNHLRRLSLDQRLRVPGARSLKGFKDLLFLHELQLLMLCACRGLPYGC